MHLSVSRNLFTVAFLALSISGCAKLLVLYQKSLPVTCDLIVANDSFLADYISFGGKVSAKDFSNEKAFYTRATDLSVNQTAPCQQNAAGQWIVPPDATTAIRSATQFLAGIVIIVDSYRK